MIDYSMPDEVYHSRPELSSTGARRILDSPARFRYWQDHQEPQKDAYDVGHAVHEKVLGVGLRAIAIPEDLLASNGAASTKAAKEWIETTRAEGRVPLKRAAVAEIDAIAEAVLGHADARTILERITGREVSIIADVDNVPSRARFDIYNGTEAGDLKTARDASPGGFNRAVGQHGYCVQERWYRDVHEAETGAPLESFSFIVVETAPPYLVGVYELDFMWDMIAKKATERARELYRACTDTDTWPGYGAASLTPPTWAVYESEEEEITV